MQSFRASSCRSSKCCGTHPQMSFFFLAASLFFLLFPLPCSPYNWFPPLKPFIPSSPSQGPPTTLREENLWSQIARLREMNQRKEQEIQRIQTPGDPRSSLIRVNSRRKRKGYWRHSIYLFDEKWKRLGTSSGTGADITQVDFDGVLTACGKLGHFRKAREIFGELSILDETASVTITNANAFHMIQSCVRSNEIEGLRHASDVVTSIVCGKVRKAGEGRE